MSSKQEPINTTKEAKPITNSEGLYYYPATGICIMPPNNSTNNIKFCTFVVVAKNKFEALGKSTTVADEYYKKEAIMGAIVRSGISDPVSESNIAL